MGVRCGAAALLSNEHALLDDSHRVDVNTFDTQCGEATEWSYGFVLVQCGTSYITVFLVHFLYSS